MSLKSLGKRPKQVSSSDEDDGRSPNSEDPLLVALAGFSEDPEFSEDSATYQVTSGWGYIGSNSPVQWLQSLQERIKNTEAGAPRSPYQPSAASVEVSDKSSKTNHTRPKIPVRNGHLEDFYFYLDNMSIDVEVKDLHVLPSAETAMRLLELYQTVVHEPFRILGDTFEGQVRKYYDTIMRTGGTLQVDTKWKATLNVVFAIGARYSHLTHRDWRADSCDHLAYMWRAIHLLELKNITVLVSAPDLSLIQVCYLWKYKLKDILTSCKRLLDFSPFII